MYFPIQPCKKSCFLTIQIILQDKQKNHTLLARQSKNLLDQLILGIWDFMSDLQLQEKQVDQILSEMIEFVQFKQEQDGNPYGKSKTNKNKQNQVLVDDLIKLFVPKRAMDYDALLLKLM